MPTVARLGNFRVVIYPNDHRPPHVHVFGGGHEAIFILNCPQGPPTLRANYGFDLRRVNDMVDQLHRMIASICDEWGRFHGTY